MKGRDDRDTIPVIILLLFLLVTYSLEDMLTQACFSVVHTILIKEGISPKQIAVYLKRGCKKIEIISFGSEF